MIRHLRLAALMLLLATPAARAEIRIGVILSITGPTASQGAGYANALQILPHQIAGQPVTLIVRDDGGDPSSAVTAGRRLIDGDHVDALMGPSFTPSAAAVLPVAEAAEVPMVGMAPMDFDPAKDRFAFDVLQPIPLMIDAAVDHMAAHGVKSVAYIGFSDGFGDQVLDALRAAAAKSGIRLADEERYARTDTSVEAQVLRAMSRHPDAVMIGGSATPGALPNIALTRRGYKGAIYNTHGVVNADYIRVGGSAVAGCLAPTGPAVVFDQLAPDNPIKPVATAFMQAYETKFGDGTRNAFAAYSEDAWMLLAHAAAIAVTHAQPGTAEFRAALRDALEATHELTGTQAIYTMSLTDHHGMDSRAAVMVQVRDGAWALVR